MTSSVDPRVALTLFDVSAPLVAAWEQAFSAWPEVAIRRCPLHELTDFDAVVAAGNSYAVMDGSLDLVMARLWKGCQQDVAEVVLSDWGGYVPVGAAAVVAANVDAARPTLVYAPTMRMPTPLVGEQALNVFDALHAALWSLHRHDRARRWRLACPGLGTGVGSVRPDVAARLMEKAWTAFRSGATPEVRAAHARRHDLGLLRVLDCA